MAYLFIPLPPTTVLPLKTQTSPLAGTLGVAAAEQTAGWVALAQSLGPAHHQAMRLHQC
jgi:hypothetical protein